MEVGAWARCSVLVGALMRHGGIITPRRQGKNNFYSLTDLGEELARVVKAVLR